MYSFLLPGQSSSLFKALFRTNDSKYWQTLKRKYLWAGPEWESDLLRKETILTTHLVSKSITTTSSSSLMILHFPWRRALVLLH